MKFIHFVMIMGFYLYLIGCSNPLGGGGSSVDDNYGPATLPAPSGYGLICGATNGGLTLLGRRADISVGSPATQMVLTTSLSRTMVLSVQGQLISQ